MYTNVNFYIQELFLFYLMLFSCTIHNEVILHQQQNGIFLESYISRFTHEPSGQSLWTSPLRRHPINRSDLGPRRASLSHAQPSGLNPRSGLTPGPRQ